MLNKRDDEANGAVVRPRTRERKSVETARAGVTVVLAPACS